MYGLQPFQDAVYVALFRKCLFAVTDNFVLVRKVYEYERLIFLAHEFCDKVGFPNSSRPLNQKRIFVSKIVFPIKHLRISFQLTNGHFVTVPPNH